jgi:precorrin-4 methylase
MKKEVVVIEIGTNNLDFMTIKALKVLEKTELVIVKDEINSEIIDAINPNSKIIYKKDDSSDFILNFPGKKVAIISLSTIHELSEPSKLLNNDIEVTSIPSVKPYLAYTAVNKVPITKRGVNLGFIIVKERISSSSLSNYLHIVVHTNASIVFCHNLGLLKEMVWQMQLKKQGDLSIAIVDPSGENGDWTTGTIDTIEDLMLLKQTSESSLIIVGEVVNQYQKRPVKELEEIFINKI